MAKKKYFKVDKLKFELPVEDIEALEAFDDALHESMSWGEVYKAGIASLLRRAESFREFMVDEVSDCPTQENKDGLESCELHVRYLKEMLKDSI